MRRLSIAAILAAPLLFFPGAGEVTANPIGAEHFGCGGYCSKLFPHMHQHGPLYNYGPYYGYYPFTPYGPWDEYLRYIPSTYERPAKDHSHSHGCSTRWKETQRSTYGRLRRRGHTGLPG